MKANDFIVMLDELKTLVREHSNPDGSCNFDSNRMETMLLITKEIFEKSVNDD